MRWRLAVCAATLGACASFTSTDPAPDGGVAGGGATCQPVGCETAGPSACTTGCSKFTFSGNLDMGVIGQCADGAVHVKAANTLDVTATLDLPTPGASYDTIVISGRLSIPEWKTDTGWVLQVAVGGKTGLKLYAVPKVDGTITYNLCAADGSTCGPSIAKTVRPPTVLAIRLTKNGIDIEMDCQRVASLPPIPLPTSASMKIEMGGSSATAFDATFADPTVAFE